MSQGEKLRIGVLGLTHDHVWDHLPSLADSEAAELVCVADPHAELRERAAAEFGAAALETFDELLAEDSLNAVYIYADNAGGARLAVRAAEAGLHVLIEKPMAADLAGADAMLSAAREHDTRLMINWPFAWWPQLQKALRLARDGAIGQVWQVKYRAAHAGPKELGCSEYFCDWLFDPERNGGGALMDYCCYGALLARHVLGTPSRVSASSGRLVKEDLAVEDNAIVVMTYPNAIAVSEGSWTQVGKLRNYETMIFGSAGTLLVEPRAGGRLLLATAEQPLGRQLDIEPTPAPRRGATEHFTHCLESGEPFYELCCDQVCRDVQEILEAARLSAASGAQTALPLRLEA